jgi:antitoxin (DNA-binding transcriptional repressor) of toxin-antitoxin stability system
MKTVSAAQFYHNAEYGRMANSGQEIRVTKNGREYFHVVPPRKPKSFVGAAPDNRRLPEPLETPAVNEADWSE